MHPTNRIIALAVLASLMPVANVRLQLLALATVSAAAVALDLIPRLVGGVRRLRWLLISLLMLYLFLDPSGGGLRIPDSSDALLALARTLPLLVVLSAALVMLAVTDRDGLITGIVTLARPVRFLGFEPERFAVRLALTLEHVPRISADLAADPTEPMQARSLSARLGRIGERATEAVRRVESAPPEDSHIRVPVRTWSLADGSTAAALIAIPVVVSLAGAL